MLNSAYSRNESTPVDRPKSGRISILHLNGELRSSAVKVIAFVGLGAIIGVAAAELQPPILIALVAGPLGLFLLVRYLEVGLIYYATFFGLFRSGLIGPIYNLVDIPSSLRAPLIGILFAVAAISFVIMKKPPRLVSMGGTQIAALLLGLVLFLGLVWTPAPEYGLLKAKTYLLSALLLLFGVALLSGELARLKRMIYVAAFLGIVFCFWGLAVAFTHQPDMWNRSILGICNPIWLARSMGVFAISLVMVGQVAKRPVVKVLMWAMAGGLTFVILYTGSRGPAFSLLLVLLVYLLFLSKRPLWQAVLLAVVGGFVLYAIVLELPSGAQIRFLYPTDPTSDAGMSFIVRREYWRQAFDLFLSHPIIGVGTGGFSYHVFGLDVQEYPHNLFLEVASELGILGVACLLAFLLASFRMVYKVFPKGMAISNQNLPAIWGIAVFLFALVNSMVSGDITGNALLWFSSGFMLATYATLRQTGNTRNQYQRQPEGSCQ